MLIDLRLTAKNLCLASARRQCGRPCSPTRSYRRVGTFESIPMPGGAKAIIEPWRMAFAYLHQLFDWQSLEQQYASLPFFDYIATKPTDVLQQAIVKNLNCPMTSACGRLFDAVSSVVGLRQQVSYEAQGAYQRQAPSANVEINFQTTAELRGFCCLWRRYAVV